MWNDRRLQGPCGKDCPDRCGDPNCHMTCEKYLAYKEKAEKLKKEEFERKEHETTMRCIDLRRGKLFGEGEMGRRKK